MNHQRLDESSVAADPITQFRRWFDEAVSADQPEPEAMALGTANPRGEPSLRWVIMRAVDESGFVFYTDERSQKVAEIAANPVAAVGFRWWVLGRQVRARGTVAPAARAESDAYFATRPRGSQIGAWASTQSAVLSSRAELDDHVATVVARFEGTDVPRPPWWGGYRITPVEVEFWQNREDRLHDRIRYRRDNGLWRVERLSP